MFRRPALLASMVLGAAPLVAQTPTDPFPTPIPASDGAIVVRVQDFATLPDVDGQPARMMHMVDEPGTARMFVSDMRGLLYSVSYDGRTVRRYLDHDARRWGYGVQARRSELGLQSFTFHPDFGRSGAEGYGRFYTWVDVLDTGPRADYTPGGGQDSHDTVLLEWTARNPAADTYDGGPPRELLRLEQPFGNHNGGQIAFNPTAARGDADFGMLYVGSADGGSGGDPLNLSQNPRSPFGKILRVDPLGTDGPNGRYGIPADNPFVGDRGTLDEIWALGVRNPQRFGWDARNGRMYVADIGQNIVEELSPVTRGANLGWNVWEGSYRFVSRSAVRLDGARSDPAMTYPVAEYGQIDALFQRQSAITGVHVYRDGPIERLRGMILFGDNPSGELFHVSADQVPAGGQGAIRRILLADGGGAPTTLLELIRARNAEQGRDPAGRADLRFGSGPEGLVLLLNKRDGVIRALGS